MLPIMHGEFRAGGDAELRFTQSGQAVCNFSIIANSNKKDPNTDEWVETGSTGWIRVNVWGALGERLANDVTKGCLVYVVGRYEQRTYQTRDQGEGTSIELTAYSVCVLPERAKQEQRGQQRSQGGADPWATAQGQSAPDPWASPQPPGPGYGHGDEPPF